MVRRAAWVEAAAAEDMRLEGTMTKNGEAVRLILLMMSVHLDQAKRVANYRPSERVSFLNGAFGSLAEYVRREWPAMHRELVADGILETER